MGSRDQARFEGRRLDCNGDKSPQWQRLSQNLMLHPLEKFIVLFRGCCRSAKSRSNLIKSVPPSELLLKTGVHRAPFMET